MFKKLKRKFILTNLLTSTVVLFVAFDSIYLAATNSAEHRAVNRFEQMVQQVEQPNQQSDQPTQISQSTNFDFNKEIDERIAAERAASNQTLLIALIITGASVEIIIALISIFLAEQSIKPVREAYQAQKDFVANASHEIKTPLAVIQANLEAADIKGNRWLDNVAKKTEELTDLNNQLLALARSESVSDDIKLTEVDLKKLVVDAASAFDPKAEEKGIDITFSSSLKPGEKVKLNRQAFEQILNIYIDNGIKYSKSAVAINIKRDRIAVISDGKPIDQNKLPHLFDRFYQTDKTSEGVGLGLAIAKSIADKNHWKVYAKVDEKYKTNIFFLEFK